MAETNPLVATLVASRQAPIIDKALLDQALHALREAGAPPGAHTQLRVPGLAGDIFFNRVALNSARRLLETLFSAQPVDIFVQIAAQRQRRMLIADMDSTMISVECIDELADLVGKKAEVAEVTEAAMQGTLDFVAALDARVALLKGLAEAELQRCFDERVAMSPGAHTLIKTCARMGVHTVLVSGGFRFFTTRVRAHLGFALDFSNTLEVSQGTLTGRVLRPIVTAQVKQETLYTQAQQQGLSAQHVLAIGDGANDILMLEAAGLGVAYRAKPKTKAAADASLEHADLAALLWVMGYAEEGV
jgi:phosphoserine phosphatase